MSEVAGHYDVIIVGAGGAGLCLLHALIGSARLSGVSVLVIDPDAKTRNDRTWCFWAKPEDRIVVELGHLLRHGWSEAGVGRQVRSLAPYHYYYLESLAFYQYVQQLARAHPQVSWLREEVRGVEPRSAAGYMIRTQEGQYTATYVFDSRINAGSMGPDLTHPEMVWQSFFGWRIRLSGNRFSKGVIRLMDFTIRQDGQCQFVYLLPFSPNEGLVEFTRFGCAPITEADSGVVLREWVEREYGAFEILSGEAGLIPMDLGFNPDTRFFPPHQRHIPIGTPAGCVKSSTGYAFHTMFTYSQALVRAMEGNGPLPACHRTRRHAFYDRLLLAILRERPSSGSAIFQRLFQKVAFSRVFTFLDERTNLMQEIPILAALPKRVFLRTLITDLFRK